MRSKFVVLALALSAAVAYAGGPRYVAGTAYFDPAALGKSIVWANGQLRYYVDLGDLSLTVNRAQANSMIAAAAAVWSAVPTAAVNIVAAGNLAEDVTGANVTSSGNSFTFPADVQSGNTAKPIAIVYDEDGSVINTIFGPGASSPSTCEQNGVFTFIDNLSPSGNIAHSLMILNGLCATTSANLAVLRYQIVRAFGQVLGLDWSQTNEEMFGSLPTAAALQGWPIMHPIERLCNASGVTCMPNGTTLRPDDIAALNRLYPVTADNISSFKNKKLTAANTLTVTGTITFRNGQGMQGVNVVLRPMIPGTTLPDVRYTVTAVSGNEFRGNAGNLITGVTDASGNALARFGVSDTQREGFFDLSGIPIPPGLTWTTTTSGVSAPTSASLSGTNGIVSQQITVGPLVAGAIVAVNACLASGSGCAQFNVVSVSPVTARLQPIAGIAQILPESQAFAPVILEVTDQTGNPLAGANVTFYETLDAWTQACASGAQCPPAPLLQQETVQATSASDGTVVLDPIASPGRAVRLYVTAVTGNSALLNFVLEQHP